MKKTFKQHLYAAGDYIMPAPPVYTGNWDEAAWVKYIDIYGEWLTCETGLPFCGFYESWANDLIDKEVETMLTDEEGNPLKSGQDGYFDLEKLNWPGIFKQYSEAYTRYLSQFILNEDGLDIELSFYEMVSPKFYNYETDAIWANIGRTDVRKLYEFVDKADLASAAAKFSNAVSTPFAEWSDDVTSWLPLQLRILLSALPCLDEEGDYPLHLRIMEPAQGNGVISEIISTNLTP